MSRKGRHNRNVDREYNPMKGAKTVGDVAQNVMQNLVRFGVDSNDALEIVNNVLKYATDVDETVQELLDLHDNACRQFRVRGSSYGNVQNEQETQSQMDPNLSSQQLLKDVSASSAQLYSDVVAICSNNCLDEIHAAAKKIYQETIRMHCEANQGDVKMICAYEGNEATFAEAKRRHRGEHKSRW